MTDKYLQRIMIIFIVLMSIMMILIGLLVCEYRFFCRHTQELISLKQQYYDYVHDTHDHRDHQSDMIQDKEELSEFVNKTDGQMTAEEISQAQASDDPDDDDEYAEDSFVVINRQPDYLKQSTMDYLQTQELDALMTAIDIGQWSEYADQKIVPIQDTKKTAIRSVESSQRTSKTQQLQKPIKDFGFVWPLDKNQFWLSSLFGPRKRMNGAWGFHHGIDMAAVKGTPVKAVRTGNVVEASFQAGYGNTVVVQHTPHIKTRYAHLNAIRVRIGQTIQAGTIVGTVGETGFIRKKGKDGSHLHFEVYENGKRINPLHCLPRMK